MSVLSEHISKVVAADTTHCIIMIREGNLTVEAARSALETTLGECDRSIAAIQKILDGVDEDLNTNTWLMKKLEEDRLYFAGKQEESHRNAERARIEKKPVLAQQFEMEAHGYGLRLGSALEGIRNTERDTQRLVEERKRVKENLEEAEWERSRLISEGGAEYQRLAERTSSENSLLQRMADLIAGKR